MSSKKRCGILLSQPNAWATTTKQYFAGQAKMTYEAVFRAYGLTSDDMPIEFAIRRTDSGEPSAEELAEGTRRAWRFIEEHNLDKVLCIGAVSHSSLHGLSKMAQINHLHGQGTIAVSPNDPNRSVYTVTTFLPYTVQKTPTRFRDVVLDLHKFCNNDAPMPQPTFDIHIANTPELIKQHLAELSKFEYVVCDLETGATSVEELAALNQVNLRKIKDVHERDRIKARIARLNREGLTARFGIIEAIGIGGYNSHNDHGYCMIVPWDVIYQDDIREALRPFLTGESYRGKQVYHNAKFDIAWLMLYFNDHMDNVCLDDTILMNYLLDERTIHSIESPHGLKTISRVRFDAPDYHFPFPEFWSVLPEYRYAHSFVAKHPELIESLKRDRSGYEQWCEKLGIQPKYEYLEEDGLHWQKLYYYLCQDLTYTGKLYELLRQEMQEESPKFFEIMDKLMMPATIALAEIEMLGAPIDIPYLHELEREYKAELDRLEREMKLYLMRHTTWHQFMKYNGEVTLHELADYARANPKQDILKTLKAIAHPVADQFVESHDWRKIKMPKSELGDDGSTVVVHPFTINDVIVALQEELASQETIAYFEELAIRIADRRKATAQRRRRQWLHKFNCNAFGQMGEAMFDLLHVPLPEGRRSTDKEAVNYLLTMEVPHSEFITMLQKFRAYSKAYNTYIIGLLESADANHRVHTVFNLHGTVTGRLSSSKPNLQNIPGKYGPVIRKAFNAPEDYLFVGADYSQLELRIAAYVSGDENMRDAFVHDRDIHTEVAAAAFRKPAAEIEKEERHVAKFIDFGVLYGRQAGGLASEPALVRMHYTEQDAQRLIDDFLDGFPKLKQYIERQKRESVKLGYCISPTGRKRRFPFLTPIAANDMMRQVVNAPIQSLASDFTLYALVRLHKLLRQYRAQVVFTIHDSIDLIVHKDDLAPVIQLVHHTMMNDLPVDDFNVPLKVDIEYGPNWGTVQKASELENSGVLTGEVVAEDE